MLYMSTVKKKKIQQSFKQSVAMENFCIYLQNYL